MTNKIAILGTKGGTGKTTTTVYLGTALAQNSTVALSDLDPQASLRSWLSIAEDQGQELPFLYIDDVSRAKNVKTDWLILDTPPSELSAIETGLDLAQFAIIPTSTSLADTNRLWPTVDYLKERGTSFGVLLTRANRRTNSFRDLVQFLDQEQIPRFATTIPAREEIAQSGTEIPRHLHGYDDLALEIEEIFK